MIRGPYKTKTTREAATRTMAREYIMRMADPSIAQITAMFPDYTEAELNEVWLAVNEAIVKVHWL